MSTSDVSGDDVSEAPCLLCAVPRDPGVRCPACGMTAEFGPDRPNPFVGATLWVMMGAIALVFAVTLLIVALTRSA